MGLFAEYKTVTNILKEKQDVVFYAESRHYYQYFEKLINDISKDLKKPILYITSDLNDPLLNSDSNNMNVVHVKWMIGHLFSKLKARMMIMTMPDLDNYHLKKSKQVEEYIYIFHAAVSTHQQYRKKAFYHYDTIFTTGHYQDNEIRMAELLYHTTAKTLVPYGYPLLDKIKKRSADRVALPVKQILVAPSWFEGCIFDSCLEDLIKELSKLSYKVLLRSHPEYEKRKRKQYSRILKLIANTTNISMDKEPEVLNSLVGSDILITDRSGIAFEFALGAGKPVLFINTALKEVNHDWKELNLAPIENSLRTELGLSIDPTKLSNLSASLKQLEELAPTFKATSEKILAENFYNSEENYKRAADYILEKSGDR